MGARWANLVGRRVGLSRAIRTIQARLAVPVGGACGRIRGYASRAERFAKQQRLQHLQAQLTWVDSRLATGRVSVCRGGRRLARHRHNLNEPSLSIEQWRGQWQAERWFLTADGDAVKRWGNETIRVHPDQHCWSFDCRPRWRACPTRPAAPARTAWAVR